MAYLRMRRELVLAVSLIGIGLLPLPMAVYWVGQQVVGDYESSAGLVGLIGQIWSDLFRLYPGAWVLVLSPYLTVLLLRIALGTRRRRRDVTRVSDSSKTT